MSPLLAVSALLVVGAILLPAAFSLWGKGGEPMTP
jgi:hypothetical protein